MSDNKELLDPSQFVPRVSNPETLPALQSHKDLINRSIVADWSTPEFKIKHFIANSHIHPLHKIRQYMIELNARQEAIENFNDEMLKLEAEIELEKEMREFAQFEGQKKLHDIEIRKKTRSLGISKEKLRGLLHEREKFLKGIEEFNAGPQARDPETGKLYIDIINDVEHAERIEAKYWEYRLAKQAATDMVAYGRIGVGNMEAIWQLDPDAQNKCIAMAYELLITNEARMNMLSDGVQERLKNGKQVSDITNLIGIERTTTLQQLTNQQEQGNDDVPLIQKR